MIEDYLYKINQYLKTDADSISSSLDYSDAILLQQQLKRSAEHLQSLKKNSSKVNSIPSYIDRVIDKIKWQPQTLKSTTIKNYLNASKQLQKLKIEKQIEMKYLVSNLQNQIEILSNKLITRQSTIFNKESQHFPIPSSKEILKLTEKLQNCIAENNILRNQNTLYREEQFLKQKNDRNLQQKFKSTLSTLSQQLQLTKTELQYQTQKGSLLQKIQAQNHLLKIQNKKLHSDLEIKLQEYDHKINKLLKDLQKHRSEKQNIQEKYNELTEIIQIVDSMRKQFKIKKKSLQYFQEQNDLLNQIQFTSAYPLVKNWKQPKSSLQQNKKTVMKNTNYK